MITQLGVVTTSPSAVRTRVIRKVTSSTVPVTGCATRSRSAAPDRRIRTAFPSLRRIRRACPDDALSAETKRDSHDRGRATNPLSGKPSRSTTSTPVSRYTEYQDRPGDHLGDGVPARSSAAQDGVLIAGEPVDPGSDPAAEPGGAASQQHRTRHEQHDFQPVAAQPEQDIAQRRGRSRANMTAHGPTPPKICGPTSPTGDWWRAPWLRARSRRQAGRSAARHRPARRRARPGTCSIHQPPDCWQDECEIAGLSGEPPSPLSRPCRACRARPMSSI